MKSKKSIIKSLISVTLSTLVVLACTLTYMEMNVDKNADKDPESFLIYDMHSAPGRGIKFKMLNHL